MLSLRSRRSRPIPRIRERLVLWTSDHCVVLINRYPYTNGHLLIAPKAHVAEHRCASPKTSPPT